MNSPIINTAFIVEATPVKRAMIVPWNAKVMNINEIKIQTESKKV